MKVLKNTFFWVVVLTLGVVAVFIAVVPKPISMNLDQIGSGQKSVVFVYDPNLVVSNQQANEMSRAREQLGEQAIFLVAKIGDPEGEGFKARYKARSTELLFFSKEGDLVDRKIALVSAENIVDKLSEKILN